LSRAEADRLEALKAGPGTVDPGGSNAEQRRAIYRLGNDLYRDRLLLAAAESGLDAAVILPWLVLAANWPRPTFPLGGRDALALGLSPGPEIGQALAAVESWWVDSGFTADATACRDRLTAWVRDRRSS
jgi:hypothetical protein